MYNLSSNRDYGTKRVDSLCTIYLVPGMIPALVWYLAWYDTWCIYTRYWYIYKKYIHIFNKQHDCKRLHSSWAKVNLPVNAEGRRLRGSRNGSCSPDLGRLQHNKNTGKSVTTGRTIIQSCIWYMRPGTLLFFSFLLLVLFQVLATSPTGGGGHDRLFLLLFAFIFFFSFSPWLFLFVSLLHRLCMSWLSYLVWWHGIAWPTAVLTAYQVRGNVVSLWRSFVTT